jgi:hypothetical protein
MNIHDVPTLTHERAVTGATYTHDVHVIETQVFVFLEDSFLFLHFYNISFTVGTLCIYAIHSYIGTLCWH